MNHEPAPTYLQHGSHTRDSASRLRQLLAEALDLDLPQNLVLSPGILIALQLLFCRLDIRRLVLSNEEYHGPNHFPSHIVNSCPAVAIVEEVERLHPDAVIVSAVSWHGNRLDVGSVFTRIRSLQLPHTPLLIADCAHIGAVGFEDVTDLRADLIVGDATKWFVPRCGQNGISYLWTLNEALFQQMCLAFRPYFLALDGHDDNVAARWIDPNAVSELCNDYISSRSTRTYLQTLHKRNFALAKDVASICHLEHEPQTAIVWLLEWVEHPLLSKMKKAGLVWHFPEWGYRILCRADVLDEHDRLAGRFSDILR